MVENILLCDERKSFLMILIEYDILLKSDENRLFRRKRMGNSLLCDEKRNFLIILILYEILLRFDENLLFQH
jgi:hypothetical protein